MDDSDKVHIRRPRPKIEEWQKEYAVDGESEFSHDVGDVSLYSYNLAINSFPLGSYVPIDEVVLQAMHNEMTLSLSALVDQGLATMSWNSDIEEITYSLSSTGKKIILPDEKEKRD
jgi:hypothetical protein